MSHFKVELVAETAGAIVCVCRALLNNMVVGVSEGFKLSLSLRGVGYRASLSDGKLVLNLGYSHLVNLPIPEGIDVQVQAPACAQALAEALKL